VVKIPNVTKVTKKTKKTERLLVTKIKIHNKGSNKMFRTEDERRGLWDRDQVHYTEIAHDYVCLAVPTLEGCLKCGMDGWRDNCKNYNELKRLGLVKE